MSDVVINIEDLATQTEGAVVKIISVSGQLDESNVDEKSKVIYQIIEQHPQKLFLIFDFANLEYMNSKSIGYLTDWYGKISENGGKVVVSGAKPNILDILQVVGLTQLIQFYGTLEEAKQGISS